MSNRMKVKAQTAKSKKGSEGSAHHSKREEKKGLHIVKGIFIALIVLAVVLLITMSMNA